MDVFEAGLFRQSSDGFVMRIPSFWIIGKSRHYLASEAQKNEIVARIKRGRRRDGSRRGPLFHIPAIAIDGLP
jgi:hypothetical protein